eukprot:12370698-Ditylum_brightwellii.AAC.1
MQQHKKTKESMRNMCWQEPPPREFGDIRVSKGDKDKMQNAMNKPREQPSRQQSELKAVRESKPKAVKEPRLMDKLTDKPEQKLRMLDSELLKKQLKVKPKPKAVNEPRMVGELSEEPEPKLRMLEAEQESKPKVVDELTQ